MYVSGPLFEARMSMLMMSAATFLEAEIIMLMLSAVTLLEAERAMLTVGVANSFLVAESA